MKIEFDPAKDAANFDKHGVSLSFGEMIFEDDNAIVTPTIREGDEEERFKAIGIVAGKLWTVIHVYRGDAVRFLSVRRSNTGEQRNYDSYSS